MKKKYPYAYLYRWMRCFYAFMLGAIVLAGCSGDVDQFIPDPILKGDIDRFYAAAREDVEQTTTINIDFPTAVVTPRKTVLIFQPRSLIDAVGSIVSGAVEIRVVELFTKGEVLLYGIPTYNRENFLSTGGEFFITATQNGKPLHLRPGMPVRILTDLAGAPYAQRMELFYGHSEYNDAMMDTVYVWEEADNNPDTWDNVDVTEWVALADSQQIVSGFGYESFSDRLNWISFQVFVDIAKDKKANFCLLLPDAYGNTNTHVFLVSDDIKSIILLRGNTYTHEFCNYFAYDLRVALPLGKAVKVVVIAEQGEDNYFFAMESIFLAKDHKLEIVPERTPLELIKEQIGKL